ncbi:hypothetical protein CC1G_15656 [Coprinopsis cinerea okayama7|uniref:DUF7330 domain-containing protein n=1 Tax=Coprinopsis cinerea (strain Okayama-7 / 130 / ATCC MYA-4618 / FGSC 9003) TaxID=240176 RepID=D6RQB6_COPC7|nr:hypothetical protein CC1G_15656 [Coprinopsis cinerea okayama7\|eukprot:XP_002910226.1 hypothetical protein CC1G_15656 [Coprinopsis cinerea okayama7\
MQPSAKQPSSMAYSPYNGDRQSESTTGQPRTSRITPSITSSLPPYYDARQPSLRAPSTLVDTATSYQSSIASTTQAGSIYRVPILLNDRNITNHVSISRQANRSLLRLFHPRPKSIETFFIDPHLKVPDGILQAFKPSAARGDSNNGSRDQQEDNATQDRRTAGRVQHRQRGERKWNVRLQLIDGRMGVTICLVPDDDPLSASRLRKVGSVVSMRTASRHGSRLASVQRTKLMADLISTKKATFKAHPCVIRINAPEPRPPFLLRARCKASPPDLPPDDTIPNPPFLSSSPITLYLPRSFRGPLTVHVATGKLDRHLWLSPGITSVSRVMDEDMLRRGYFLGYVPDVEEEIEDIIEEGEELRDGDGVGPGEVGFGQGQGQGQGQMRPVHHRRGSSRNTSSSTAGGGSAAGAAAEECQWLGDKVELDVEDGMIRILFEDEALEGVSARRSSCGWLSLL